MTKTAPLRKERIALWRHPHLAGAPCNRNCAGRVRWWNVMRVVRWQEGYDVAVIKVRGKEYMAVRRQRGEPFEANIYYKG